MAPTENATTATTATPGAPTGLQKAVRWHPPSYDIRVEEIPIPQIEHPDDAIVKITLAALCGSDLHIYRGHGGVSEVHTCGHEFIGEVVALGSSFGKDVKGRPALYSSLKVGDRIVSPFTVNCGECSVCRLGYTGRCPEGFLFGSPALNGGQAQYIRVPKAGGTLFNLSDPSTWSSSMSAEERKNALANLSDSSLLMLADILPTGVFAALQAINHPKVQPVLTGKPWPLCFTGAGDGVSILEEDRVFTAAIIGLGPVGVCAAISLLDTVSTGKIPFRIIAIDPNAARREKMKVVYDTIDASGKAGGEFSVLSIDEAKAKAKEWTNGVGCTAVLEVVGNVSALNLSYELVSAFGVIVSVGVHGEPPLPFTGRQVYNKNVSLDFGRCPARAMFPPAFDLLVKRQDIFGSIGEPASLIDSVVDFGKAAESYSAFDKGEVGKVIFDPWK
ncbi:alcohol dehydrogenase [Coprinopsis cinerea okayama7|uniref:Alcohol dehydrogenase n=1 Tax=Coprinopsis cinerea (strain Okayama-7 / 130 / ATCC MYA-4618 / FGSC 9003) TaxID=240176 RepID=A8NRP0_COPC7|nr:alcohol dehydrogenase [Coprinopsis cinerea okayama7\|eukprot:XP_001835820.1 alcohol dehydrogenase [Coprinopsis cinerea okayama7\